MCEISGEQGATPFGDRLIGSYGGRRQGPLLLVVSALHGNEPSGVQASRAVLEQLEREAPEIMGEVLFLVGNTGAMARGVRFIDRDLNRIWTPEIVKVLRGGDGEIGRSSESLEQNAILELINTALPRAEGGAYLVDLHTSSADGRPFLTVGDTLRNRRFARAVPLPKILGLEEQIDGSLLEYMNNLGMVTLGVEAGRHDDPFTVEIMAAVIRLVLLGAGMFRPEDASDAVVAHDLLMNSARSMPGLTEIRHRHPIDPGDGFRMEAGFANFQPVRAGTLLARDRHGEIRAGEDGLVFLPLYQGQGSDGFFLAREVRPFWMRLSAILRTLRIGRLLPLLPGIARHRGRPGVLVVDTRIARWFPLDVLHLLGFRKLRKHGSLILASRRKNDQA